MKKILSLVMVALMLVCFATATSAAEMEFVEVKSFDFSNTEGLKGFTASWPNPDSKCNAVAAEVGEGVIVDGKFVMGTMGFVMDETVDATNGIKITFDAAIDHSKVGNDSWWKGIVSFINPDGKADEFLALSGEVYDHSYDAYYLNLTGGSIPGLNFQTHTGTLHEEGAQWNTTDWGGDVTEALVDGQTYAVEFIVVPNAEGGADVTITVDGVDIGIPNHTETNENFDGHTYFENLLSEETIVTIGATHYGDYPPNVTVDNVKVYTMQEVVEEPTDEPTDAPQTGFATIALAVVAIASGAYIVSKKH